MAHSLEKTTVLCQSISTLGLGMRMRTGSPLLCCYHVGRAGGRLGGEGAGWGEAAAPVPPAGEVDGRPGHCQRPPQGGQHLCQVQTERGIFSWLLIEECSKVFSRVAGAGVFGWSRSRFLSGSFSYSTVKFYFFRTGYLNFYCTVFWFFKVFK